jgi:hypothetical protein
MAHAVGLTDFYNRLHDPDERSEDIIRLRELHTEMDRAVLRAYGWDDLAARAEPMFLDETNEDDPTYQGPCSGLPPFATKCSLASSASTPNEPQ